MIRDFLRTIAAVFIFSLGWLCSISEAILCYLRTEDYKCGLWLIISCIVIYVATIHFSKRS